MELLGEANNDHEKQQEHKRRGAHCQAHHLELCHHRLTAGALVPDVVLDVASRGRLRYQEKLEEEEKERDMVNQLIRLIRLIRQTGRIFLLSASTHYTTSQRTMSCSEMYVIKFYINA